MSWEDIKKGASKVSSKADTFRKDAMGKIDNRGHSPKPSNDSSADGDGPPPAPGPRHLPPPRTSAAPVARPRATSSGALTAGGTGVFTNLSEEDKEAFFALLDEYFESRPHLLGSADSSAAESSGDPVANLAAKHGPALAAAAIRNPTLTAAAMRSQGVNSNVADSISRAAAGAAAKKPPPAPPSASSAAVKAEPPVQRGPKGAVGLTTGRSIGNMPTSSGKAAFGHVLTNTGKDKPPADTSFSNTAAMTSRGQASPPPTRTAAAVPPPPPSRGHGIGRARALYDYQGTDEGDLSFSEGDEITVLEHVDESWQRGELRGQTGIYPTNYVEQI